MKLTLPFPPSVNTYWRAPNKGPLAGRHLVSAAGRKYQSEACAAIVEQLRRLPKPSTTPAAVAITLFPPDQRRRDLDIQDPQPAIEGLMNYALALRNPAMKKLSDEARAEMALCLAQFAYSDYARSAASSCECDHCNGKGVIRIMREVVKHPGVKGIEATVRREEVEELCKHCEGKGKISTACRDCSGRGTAIDKKRSLLHGVPVQKVCDRCNGKGFSRLPTTLARARVARLVPDMTDYQWYNGYAEVINKLVTKCWLEETYAELKLREVTR